MSGKITAIGLVVSDINKQYSRKNDSYYANFVIQDGTDDNPHIYHVSGKNKMCDRIVDNIRQGQLLYVAGFPRVAMYTDKNDNIIPIQKIILHEFKIIK